MLKGQEYIEQQGVPIKLTGIAIELQNLIEKEGVDTFSVYMGTEKNPYGIVWVRGDIYSILSGIHAMIRDVAKTLNKTENEVASMVLSAKPKDVTLNYQ